jgi:hypothetical protein
LDGFTFFSKRLAKGSRIRLLLKCPNSIYLQKNYNSGGVVAEESGKHARTATVTVYHDEGHPSYLELPIVEDQALRARQVQGAGELSSAPKAFNGTASKRPGRGA